MRQTFVAQSTFTLHNHAPQLRTPCILSDVLTPPQERLTGVKFGQQIHRDHVFTACIVYTMVVETDN